MSKVSYRPRQPRGKSSHTVQYYEQTFRGFLWYADKHGWSDDVRPLVDDAGSPLGISPPQISHTFRGGARADGEVNIADVLFICQYLVGLRDPGDGLDKVQAVIPWI